MLPVRLGPGDGLGVLQVLVNTRGGAVSAALYGPDPEDRRILRRAGCGRVESGARVAFDARCVLGPSAGLPARVELRLQQVSRDGLQTELLETSVLRVADPEG